MAKGKLNSIKSKLNSIYYLAVPVVRQKIRVKLALAIPTGTPIILVNAIIDTPPLVALKTIKTLSMQSKAVTYLFFLLYGFLWLISWWK